MMPHKSAKEQETNFAEVYFLNMLRHPNIVQYFNSFVLPDEIWVAMEFLQAKLLQTKIRFLIFLISFFF